MAEEAIRRFIDQPFQGTPLAVNHARARENGPGVRKNASAHASLVRTDWTTEPGVAETRPPQRGGRVTISAPTRPLGASESRQIGIRNQAVAPKGPFVNGSAGNSLVGMRMMLTAMR